MIYVPMQAGGRVCDIFHEPSYSCTFLRRPVNYPGVNSLHTCKKRRETFCAPETGLFRPRLRAVKTSHRSVLATQSASGLLRPIRLAANLSPDPIADIFGQGGGR